ncbi:MAG TPA: hypothetical protein PKC39_13570 [Ferruginibacter sp.]|nr:hypothetical protein [Ferruginibacter sp.]HMP21984.1 hypothetical protein [Ferruginibacter sp.]
MKYFLLTFTYCVLTFTAKPQKASVEKSTFGIQAGVVGIWLHHEAKLSGQLSLRSETGLYSGIFGSKNFYEVGFVMTPVITLEPRWYYNLNNRVAASKSIAGNNGNYFSLKTSFYPDWFVISDYNDIRVVNQIAIIPMWGIRRNIGNHFTF